MQPSIVGLIICVALLLVGYYSRGVLIVSLIASLAFGGTAVVTLSSLGGSSPLIYTFFTALLLVSVTARWRIWRDLGTAFGSMRPLWVLGCLMLYAVAGSWLFPRLFAGQTTVFVVSKLRQGVVEAALEPVSGNITQAGYFVMGGLTTIGLSIFLLNSKRIYDVRSGFFIMVTLHAAMGLVDLLGKLARLGDVLKPIRTANYAMLTNESASSFFRIAGAFSEASAFGASSLACLAFTYTYWRKTGAVTAQWLSLLLFVLLLLSTSSTAYGGLVLLSLPVAMTLSYSFIAGRLKSDDALIMACLLAMVFVVLAIQLYDSRILQPFVNLIESTVINKGSSASGQERGYWNLKSLQSFVDTSGLGVGLGSSRASSWLIAVLSQLGLIGTLALAALVVVLARGMGKLRVWVDPETNAIVASVRASALAGLVSGSLVSGSADPGMIFFISLSVVVASRTRARHNRAAAAQAGIAYPPRWRWAPGRSTKGIHGRPGYST